MVGQQDLPIELWRLIINYLEPRDIAQLQQASRRLREFCLDPQLWKQHCFERSSWYHSLRKRRSLRLPFHQDDSSPDEDRSNEMEEGDRSGSGPNVDGVRQTIRRRAQKSQDMANWDPSFPGEKVSWYDEYIQREGPICVNWLETSHLGDRESDAIVEARGLAMFSPYDGDDGIGTKLAVSPLDDGSVCLWDINGSRGRLGGILEKSGENLLYHDGSGNPTERLRSQRIDSSIADRVSIDNWNHKAYFAIQSHLMEVDLETLRVVSRDAFEWSITTLSPIHSGKPLIVGTSLGLHEHDFRTRARVNLDAPERLEGWASGTYKAIFDHTPLPRYASLSQPTPTSIVYLPRSDCPGSVGDEFYVSGRFSSILHYDLRKFPAIVSSIHSGAVVNSLAALPHPFSTLDHEVRKDGEPTEEKVAEIKGRDGSSLIAGGSYNQKGSLEIYGLWRDGPGTPRKMVHKSVFKNRVTAASSPILSIANHGTKLVFSDGSGTIKWFERDGETECRRLRIGHSEAEARGAMSDSDDVARKIISTKTKHGESRLNNDNILFWTGERLGLVSFTTKSLFEEKDFANDDSEKSAEDQALQEQGDQMRDALMHHANEVRFLSNLGWGTRSYGP